MQEWMAFNYSLQSVSWWKEGDKNEGPVLPILPIFYFHPCLFKVELATLNERMEGGEAKQEVERSREA